jgi:hypothetical protein
MHGSYPHKRLRFAYLREFPLSWMKRHLERANFRVLKSKNFTILHSEESVGRQIRVSVNACAPVSSFNCQLRFIDTQLLQDEDRLTALHMAAMNGQVEVVKLLLSRNALPAVKTSVSNKIIGIYSLNKQRFHT